MGARYLKAEETVIREYFSTAAKEEILARIPNRSWAQIGVKARKMGIYRTSEAWGNSIREGRKILKHSWSYEDNDRFDSYYPHFTRSALLNFFYPRTWLALQSHAEKLHIHRTREAVGREIEIGRKNARAERTQRE